MGPRQLPQLLLTLALAAAACHPTPQPERSAGSQAPAQPTAAAAAPVLPGIEVLLRDSLQLVRGKRVGFITNQTAVTRDGQSGIDLLAAQPEFQLVALYGPEHGLRGGVKGGTAIASGRDAKTGIPVFSLYGKTQKPTPEMLKGVDVLLFDMQDIGARPFTFVWTMAMAMEVAAKQKIPFVVLDRPNPITDRVEGPLMEMAMRTVAQPITGYYPVPLRHGMTVGEIAKYINGEYHVGADLHVVPAAGWRGDEWFDETGLPWVNPSPNIRSLEAALAYSGLVLMEATNLSVGRGTDAPFSYVGAPWVNTDSLMKRLAAYDLPGAEITPTTFVPSGEGDVLYRGEPVRGVHLRITDRNRYRAVFTALVLLTEIKALHPDRFRITNSGMTQMLGSQWARQAVDRGEDPRTITRRWEEEDAAWMPIRNRYRLYPAR